MPDELPDPMAQDELAGLAEELRTVASRVDPVPEHLAGWAAEAFAWRTIDADLAMLRFDSYTDETALVRSDDRPRLLTFGSDQLSIEVEISRTAAAHQLVGQVTPPHFAEVEVEYGERRSTASVDALGRFTAAAPDTGPFRLRFRRGSATGSRVVVTDWISR